jgi:hypothetical protein
MNVSFPKKIVSSVNGMYMWSLSSIVEPEFERQSPSGGGGVRRHEGKK